VGCVCGDAMAVVVNSSPASIAVMVIRFLIIVFYLVVCFL
jgi:hypothetical protein